MNDLPDSALEAVQTLMSCACNNPNHHDARAALAAASGPWAEHPDAASTARNAYKDASEQHLRECMSLVAERDAALARNAELQAENESMLEALRVFGDVHVLGKTRKERDALRAELDSLRDRVNALADEWEPKFPIAGDLMDGRLPAYARLRAIVRGSDDEAACATCGHPKLRHEFVKVGDTHCSECKCPEWVAR